MEGSLEVHLPWLRRAHPVEAAPWLAAGCASEPSRNRVVSYGGGAEAGTVDNGLPSFQVLVQELDQPGALEQHRCEAVGPLPSQWGSLRSVPGHMESEPGPELDA